MRREKARCRMFSTAATKLLALGVMTLAFFLSLAKPVSATPVYSQNTPSEPGSDFTSINTASRQKIADNFLVNGTETFTVRSLRFIGGYGVNNPPPSSPPIHALPPDSFRVAFFEDAAGSPGSLLAGGDFSVSSVFSRTPTGGQLLNGDLEPIKFSIDLGSGIALSEGTEYWISISNAPGPDHGWGWARANGVLDQKLASTFNDPSVGPWNVFGSGGMWFVLDDQNIPEPTSLTIVLTALAPASLIRKGAFS